MDNNDVSFNENEGFGAIKYYHQKKDPRIIVGIKKISGGLIKTDKQAAYVIIILAVLTLAAGFWFYRSTLPETSEFVPPDQHAGQGF